MDTINNEKKSFHIFKTDSVSAYSLHLFSTSIIIIIDQTIVDTFNLNKFVFFFAFALIEIVARISISYNFSQHRNAFHSLKKKKAGEAT